MNNGKKTTAWVLIMMAVIIVSLLTKLNKFGIGTIILESGGIDESESPNQIIQKVNEILNDIEPSTTTKQPTTTTSTTTTRKPTTTSRSTTTTRKPTTTRSTTTTRKPTTTRSTTTTRKPTTTRSRTTTRKPTTTSRSTTTTRKPTTTRSTTTTARITTTRKPAKPEGPLNLTPLLKNNQIQDALSRAQVHHRNLTKESYAGYFTTHESANSSSFFWYFPAEVNTDKAPVVVYLEGFLSNTVAFSIFVRNGPLIVDSEGRLRSRRDSWNIKHNMLYIDTAACSGYSFQQRERFQSPLDQVALEVMEAMKQFFQMFPSLRINDLYVAGESFAALLVITTANKIYNDNLYQSEKIRLKGIAIGNGLFASKHQLVFSNILYNLGLVDSNQRKTFETDESDIQTQVNSEQAYSILASSVLAGNNRFHNVTAYDWQYNFHDVQPPATYKSKFADWVNRPDVRQALHVGDNNIAIKPDGIGDIFMAKVIASNVGLYFPFRGLGYRVLIYTGNLDIVCSYASVENWLNNTPQAEEFRKVERQPWRDHRDKLAGYTKTFGQITEVLVRNAGHFTSIDRPRCIKELLEDFTSGKL